MADLGLAARLAAQNPDLVAREAAMQGLIPPGMGAAGTGLSQYLDPITGIKAPAMPEQPSLAATPSAPGVPSPSQTISQESALLDLIMKGIAPQAQPGMNLSALLGR